MRLYMTRRRVHVGQIVFGDQGGHAQLHFGAVVQRTVELGLAAFADGLDGALQQLGVEREADLLDLAALLVAEQLAGTADLQVVGGQGEAGAELFEGLDGFEALAGRRRSWLRGGGVIR